MTSQTKVLALVGALALSACSLGIGGLLKVKKELKLTKPGLLGSTIVIPPGTYDADVDYNGLRDFVELSVDNVGGRRLKARFNAPVDHVPLDGTWVDAAASQTGQPYDVTFSIKRDIVKDPTLYHEYQSCAYQQCYTVCNGPNGQDCHQQCNTYTGTQHVEYYIIDTYWNTAFKLGKGGSHDDASFTGKRHDRTRDYVYQGPCR